ncbi:hypothetical protein [Corallococcus sp. CA054B]|uniref:hypothetical protein n=1 Tax=Corallococcus sp. CA054B TaxID=2316734 RepID=UPI0011C45431|nr:hypothetical protein [Corallococcus sp. CA054B]
MPQHKHSNSSQSLRFRFLTTASVGTERPSPFTPRYPALGHWRNIVSQNNADKEVVEKLVEILRSSGRPDGLADDTWTLFQGFLASSPVVQFFEFMKLVEWSFDAGDLNALVVAIRSKLIQKKYASTEEESQDLYQRLFFYVFSLLSQSGLKAVSRQSLITQLTRPPLAPQQQALFAQITGHLLEIENRVVLMEQGLSTVQQGLLGVEQNLAMYRSEVQRIVASQGLSASITLGRRTFVYAAPPIGQGIVERRALVASLQNDLATTSLLVLSGQSSIGKTQLARSMIDHEKTLWLSLRHRKMDDIVSLFETAMVVADNERKALVVLDDLPRLSAGMQLVERLLHYANSDLCSRVKLIATTSAPLPLALREDTPAGFLMERLVPLLSRDEIREVLEVHRVPADALTENLVQFAYEVTTGHPVLARALIRFLQERDWNLSEETIQEVLMRGFARDVQREAQTLLLQTVQGEAAREFLYRLDLVVEPIRERQLKIVAEVVPVVPAPFERLDELRGLWIQETSSERYMLSPLLEGMGVRNLRSDIRNSIHRGLGNEIVRRQQMSVFEADVAIHHFVSGALHDRAGLVYLMATASILENPRQIRQFGLAERWMNSELPLGMSRSVKIHVRGVQVRVVDALGGDPMPVLQRLDVLLDDATVDDALAVMHASLNAGPLRVNAPSQIVEKYYLHAIDASQKMIAAGKGPPVDEFHKAIYGMIWMNGARVRTLDDLRGWIRTVRQIGDVGRKFAVEVVDDALRDESCFMLPQQVALEEYGKNAEKRDWLAVIAAQEELERDAFELGFVALAGFSAAAQIAAIYEGSKDLDRIVRVSKEALRRYGYLPIVEFAVRVIAGMQFGHAKMYSEALAEIEAALGIDTGGFAIVYRLHAQIEAARSAYYVRPSDAVGLAEKAVQLATAYPVLGPLERVKALGELGVHLSERSGVQSSYSVWAETVREILLAEEDSPKWRALFSIVGHSVGYYLFVVTTGNPPDTVADGGHYAKPLPGTFLRYSEEVERFYVHGNKGLICAQLAMYAEAIGDDQEARRWAERGVRISEESGNESARALLAEQVLPYLLTSNAFSEAIRGSVEAATTLLREQRRALSPEALQASSELTLLNDGESMGRFRALLPVFIRLAHMRQQGDPLAKTAAYEVVGTCNHFAARSARPEFWMLAAKIFDAAFLRAASAGEFAVLVSDADGLQENPLKVMAVLGGSFASDVSLVQGFVSQVVAFGYIVEILRLKGGMARLVLQPFVSDFWMKRFRSGRFGFRAPAKVEESLIEARRRPGVAGIRALFSALQQGLGVALPAEQVRWLTDLPKEGGL